MTGQRIPRSMLWLVRSASLLVPRRRRKEWCREWEAELHHRWGVLETLDGRNRAARRELVRWSRGAFVDAFWFKLEGLRDGIMLDLRHSLRRLRREPGFVVCVIVLMALGIGANTALFSVVRGVLLLPLPYSEPQRLVRVWETNASLGLDTERPSPGDLQYWRANCDAFSGIAAWYVSSKTLQNDGPAETRISAQVSNDFFRLLGVPPVLGRTFTDDEVDRSFFSSSNTHVGEAPVVVLSHRLWRQRFASDPAVIGRTVQIERKPWLVVGVMPAGFAMPDPQVDLWLPWSFAKERPRDQRYTQVIARIGQGLEIDEAQARLTALSLDMAERFPETNAGWGVRLTPLRDELVGEVQPALWSLLGAVGSVLLIVVLNIAGLQLVRATSRQREVGVRVALGASRGRLVRQNVIESLVLALVGGGIGLALAAWGVNRVKLAGLDGLPRLDEVVMDGRVLLFAVVVTTLTGLLFGLGPALTGLRGDLAATIKDDSGTVTVSAGRQRVRRAIVVAQVAVAVVLLTGAGLLLRSFTRLSAVDPGFTADNVLVMPILLNGSSYGGGKAGVYYESLTETLAAMPGVEAAGGATVLPLSAVGPDFSRPIWREGHRLPPGEAPQADIRMVTPGYFDTLEIPLRRGRPFDRRDRMESRRVVIVNETVARLHWPEEDPVGHELMLDYGTAGTHPFEVVGVVGDVRFHGLRHQPRAEVYLPHAQRPYLIMNVAVRTSGDPLLLAESVRRAVLEVDPMQPVHSVVALRRMLGGSVERDRLSTLLMGAFAGVALLLAAVGLYGVVSYHVHQRAREIGIRMALGARAGQVRRLVLWQGIPLVAAGLLVGGAAAFALTRGLASQLYEIPPHDPLTFVAVAATLALVALIASYIPARRASRVEPTHVLRHS